MISTGAKQTPLLKARMVVLYIGLLALAVSLIARLVFLQVLDTEHGYEFLQHQGNARTLRTETIPAHRGILADRHGTPLAVSTPVESVWVNPQKLLAEVDDWSKLARAVNYEPVELQRKVSSQSHREFVYLRRRLPPDQAASVSALELPGVYLQREYQRFYPAGEVISQLVGVTDIDDHGLEGFELAFDEWLSGTPGSKRVVKDRFGNTIRDLNMLQAERSGADVYLSIDLRLQYLAYRELKKAVLANRATGGSIVVVDTRTGEVLALANQPSYNPNRRRDMKPGAMRNRAITDLYEPGSTVKPFTVLAALENGSVSTATTIDTSPGYLNIEGKVFRDARNYGALTLDGILMKSSQVGITRIALSMEQDLLRDVFVRAGFGEPVNTGFPGESIGIVPDYRRWSEVQRATFAFGYGLSATPLQLARAYATLASGGVRRELSLLRLDEVPAGERVFSSDQVTVLNNMLSGVVEEAGTGTLANIAGYQVAGKTGTVQKLIASGYAEDRHVSLFAGFAPASKPRLAAVVIIDDPRAGDYYGGVVAAPVFGAVVGNALRMLNVTPDNLPELLIAQGNPAAGPV